MLSIEVNHEQLFFFWCLWALHTFQINPFELSTACWALHGQTWLRCHLQLLCLQGLRKYAYSKIHHLLHFGNERFHTQIIKDFGKMNPHLKCRVWKIIFGICYMIRIKASIYHYWHILWTLILCQTVMGPDQPFHILGNLGFPWKFGNQAIAAGL